MPRRAAVHAVLTWLGLPVEYLIEPPAWCLLECDEDGALVRQAVVSVVPTGVPILVPMAELLIETSTGDKLVTCVTPGGRLQDG